MFNDVAISQSIILQEKMNLGVGAQSSQRNCSMSCAVIYSTKKTFYKVLNPFGNEIIYSKTLIYPGDKLFFLVYCLKLNSITFTKNENKQVL